MKHHQKQPKTKTNLSKKNNASMARNYSNALKSQVNIRTGELDIGLLPPLLVSSVKMDINLGVIYHQGSSRKHNSLFGLPNGWTFNLSYIHSNEIVINGTESYQLSHSSRSGMLYYEKENLELKYFNQGEFPVLPYDKSQNYAYILKFYDGHNQYFDEYGKLICYDDKYMNHQLFYYDINTSITDSKLIKVIGTEKQTAALSFNKGEIRISYLSNAKNRIQFSYKTTEDNLRLTEYIDPLGNITSIEYNGGLTHKGLISKISYPNKLNEQYSYKVISYLDIKGEKSLLNVVNEVTRSYGSDIRTTTYNYNPHDNNHNYTGFPIFKVVPGEDTLLQSMDNNYRYYTTVNDGITEKTHEFNRLHLELKSTERTLSGVVISETTKKYHGEEPDSIFPYYKSLPSNYQFCKEEERTFYNEMNDCKTYKTTSEYNGRGQITNVANYELEEGDFKITNEIATTYDPKYGVLSCEDKKDYMPDGIIMDKPTIKRINNILTTNKKSILKNQIGSVNGDDFTPIKNTSYKYDEKGRCIFNKLYWENYTHKEGIRETTQTYAYTEDIKNNTFTKSKTDHEGNESSEVYDLNTGLLLTKISANNEKEDYTYDDLGQILSQTSPTGVIIKRCYDYVNNKVTTSYQNGYQNFTYYNGFGDCIKKSDIRYLNGKERILEQYIFNNKGQLSSKEGILGDNSKHTYSYNDYGLISCKKDSEGNTTSYAYDPVSLTKQTYLNGTKTKQEKYNTQKKVIRSTLYSLDEKHDIRMISKRYNSQNLIVNTTSGNSSEKTMKQKTQYDVFDNPIRQVDAGFDGMERTNELTRDLLSNVLHSTRALSGSSSVKKSTTQIYNTIGQLTSEVFSNNKSMDYTYDKDGNVIASTDLKNNRINYTYFADKKLRSKSYLDENGEIITINYDYDHSSNLLTSIKRVSTNKATVDIMHYSYSLDGLLTKLVYPDGKSVSWEYDENNLLSKLTDINGQDTTYIYDRYGRIKKVQRENLDEFVSIKYYGKNDKAYSGQVKSVSYSNGVTISYCYSDFNLISKIIIKDSNEQTLLSVDYKYDNVSGNISLACYRSNKEGDVVLNYDIAYKYNGINQLTSEKKTDKNGNLITNTDYTYDASNNILSKTITRDNEESTDSNYIYDEDNKLTSIKTGKKTQFLTYDENGNLTKDSEGNLYSYNTLNQLISFTSKSGIITKYSYYPTGLRSSKKVGQEEEIVYYYDNEKNPNIINEQQAETVSSYLMFKSERFIRLYNDGSSVNREYMLQSEKSIMMVVDFKGNIVSSYNYSAYGEGSINENTYSIKSNPFMYNKEYFDYESGLYYLRSRYYSPNLMCFISRDSIVIFNHYAFATGNPIKFTDPSGHLSFLETLGITVAAVAVVGLSIAAAIVSGGTSAVAEGAGSVGASVGSSVGEALGGAEGADVGAATGKAVAAGAASGAVKGAATGSVLGAAIGSSTGVGAGTGAAIGTTLGSAVGGASGLLTAAFAEGTAAGIGATSGIAIGSTIGGFVGSALGESIAGAAGAQIGLFLGASAGGSVGGVIGSVAGSVIELGASAGGIVGTASTVGTSITGFVSGVSDFFYSSLATIVEV
ncbi:RHS repeat-associated core domain-containing protein [Pseudoalteromonas luteoviolacea]|uniref:RHS repeat-associated core domain-containing protein n=1 Tax=Pseudoalteromonas luteoviolacea TaxID=43657 RepID=UPI001B3747B7|nr:RHS repeat-associated core domain-containing protein [Pseudoalteromonas luteoviolacea]MBQ4835438.1 hypothetical protein [Pseudoalteromonas luteoviolacea]